MLNPISNMLNPFFNMLNPISYMLNPKTCRQFYNSGRAV